MITNAINILVKSDINWNDAFFTCINLDLFEIALSSQKNEDAFLIASQKIRDDCETACCKVHIKKTAIGYQFKWLKS